MIFRSPPERNQYRIGGPKDKKALIERDSTILTGQKAKGHLSSSVLKLFEHDYRSWLAKNLIADKPPSIADPLIAQKLSK